MDQIVNHAMKPINFHRNTMLVLPVLLGVFLLYELFGKDSDFYRILHFGDPVINERVRYLASENDIENVYAPFGQGNIIEKKLAEESKQAFLDAYTVFMHPRCMNCHPKGDVPLQGDDSHLHTQGVVRGVDGKGVYANKCSNCHQPTDIQGLNLPPSHPNWHLPPAHRKMVFEGKSPRDLAMSFKDSAFTGFETMDRFIEHVETDKLVLHSFTYGNRPPLDHDEFVARVKEWIEKGAVVPD